MGLANRIAGVVILYNPPAQLEENIRSYAPYLSKLLVIDNSPFEKSELRDSLIKLARVEFIFPGKNLGLAAGLNLAANMAIIQGYDWLLTMDQDSHFEENGFLEFSKKMNAHRDAGILSPRHVLGNESIKSTKTEWESVPVVMTSGNLLNLSVFSRVGPFHEPLFIDYVDHEFCFRLRKMGFLVWRNNKVILMHSLGELREERRLGLTFRPTNHSPLRRYYMTRNRLYVMFHYKRVLIPELFALTKEILKFVLFEKMKREKLKFIVHGVFDFLRKKYGPFGS